MLHLFLNVILLETYTIPDTSLESLRPKYIIHSLTCNDTTGEETRPLLDVFSLPRDDPLQASVKRQAAAT